MASSPGNTAPPNFANGSNLIGQNFSPSVITAPEDPSGFTATPSPQPAAGDPVYLTSFQFTKSNVFNAPQAAGNANTVLIVENGAFPNFSGLNTTNVTGVSSNTVDTTHTVAQGTALTWNFNGGLQLVYGNSYTVGMATLSGTTITFIQADVQLVHFTETPAGSGTFVPDTNYGGSGNFNAAALYSFNGSFFGSGSNAEDTVFTANFSTTPIPEPASLGILGLTSLALAARRRK
ncbi:MAG TPA: PEP-CTERM sorting domain-containing protein [Tepidisphaeraceae bacterium]|nr:PEP-CTERM sorting domain-containing protein [Tepidisphaeraceae bacterium]